MISRMTDFIKLEFFKFTFSRAKSVLKNSNLMKESILMIIRIDAKVSQPRRKICKTTIH